MQRPNNCPNITSQPGFERSFFRNLLLTILRRGYCFTNLHGSGFVRHETLLSRTDLDGGFAFFSDQSNASHLSIGRWEACREDC